MDHVRRIRECAVLLAVDARISAEHGDSEGALQDLLAGMDLADALAAEPHFLSYGNHTLIHEFLSKTYQEVFAEGDLPPEHVAELTRRLDAARHRQASIDALEATAYLQLELFSDLRTLSAAEFREKHGPPEGDDDTWPLLGCWMLGSAPLRPLVNTNEAGLARAADLALELARLPPHEALSQLESTYGDYEDVPFTQWFAYVKLVPILNEGLHEQARHEITIDLMRMGIAVENYRTTQDRYPASLDGIASDLGGVLPIDPFSGQAYRYETTGDGFSLYSVGRNRTDDGGRRDTNTGDIVWRGSREYTQNSG